jgi:hypothetical protein
MNTWHTLTQASPELAASCEEMMVELDWHAEQLRQSGDSSYKELFHMVLRARRALDKAQVGDLHSLYAAGGCGAGRAAQEGV